MSLAMRVLPLIVLLMLVARTATVATPTNAGEPTVAAADTDGDAIPDSV